MKNGYFKYLLLCLVFLATTLTLPAAVIFSEDFNASTNLPDGWTTEQLEESRPADRVWRCDNPGNKSPSGNFSGNFAIYDGAYFGYASSPNVNNHLTTPAIDCSGETNVTLAFDHYLQYYSYGHVATKVQVSNDGTTWNDIAEFNSYGGGFVSYDISDYAAGKSSVQIRWYYDSDSDWWAVDNVQLISFTDQPLPVTLNSPADNADRLPVDTKLTWTPSPMGNQPTGYKVYVDTVNPPEAMVYEGEETSFEPTLSYKATYYWQVIPYNEHGSADAQECEVRSFKTMPAEPLPVLLVGPVDNDKDVHSYTKLEWKPQAEGFQPVGYKVYMDTNNPPETLVYDGVNTNYSPGYDFETTYYWRVVPYSADASTPTEDCPVWKFKTVKIVNLPFTEKFDGFKPEGWKTEDLSGRYPNHLWTFNNGGGREPGGNFDEDFAVLDEEVSGSYYAESALITAPINCSTAPNLTIAFDHILDPGGWYGAEIRIDVCSDEENWEQAFRQNYYDEFEAEKIFVNLSPFAANKDVVYIRFIVEGTIGYYGRGYYAIDNLETVVYEGIPHIPSLASPTNNKDDLPITTKLTWNAPELGPEITGYRVYLDTVEPPVDYYEVENVLESSPTLAYNTEYYWQVVPFNTYGVADREECETWSFETQDANPLPVTLNIPADNAQDVILGSALTWTPSYVGIKPTGYKVRLDTENPPRESSEEDVGDVVEWAPGFDPETTYYWQVIPYAADGEANLEDCVVRSFTTNPARPYAANVVVPADNATSISVAQMLQWAHADKGEQATGYKVYLDTVNPPTVEIFDGLATEYAATLDFEKTYYWQVVPYNEAGDASNCPVWKFETATILDLPILEEFTETTQPAGWHNLIEGENPEGWRFTGHMPTASPGTLFKGNYASAYRASNTGAVNTSLITPAFDCTGIEEIKVAFTSRYTHHNTPQSSAKLEVSSDGVNWDTVQTWSANHNQNQTIDISDYAANKSLVYVRWNFSTIEARTGVAWWKIDNVFIYGPMPPNPAVLSRPVNNAVDQATNTRVYWTAPTTGVPQTGYNLYIGTDEELDVDPIDVGTVLNYLPEMEFDTTYYWQVVPYNNAGEADRAESQKWSFTTRVATPLPVTYDLPADGKENVSVATVKLEWKRNSQGEPATGYKVYLDENNPPTTEVYDGADYEFSPEGLELLTTYYWLVVPYNEHASTATEDCAVWSFTTAGPPMEAGTYVVNLDYPEVGDFRTVRDAVDAVVNRGISGPVVIDVNPGRYDDDGQVDMHPIHFKPIPGSSAENTVTVTNTNTEQPAIIDVATYSYNHMYPDGNPPAWAVAIDGASNIRFENIYFSKAHGYYTDAHIGMWNGSHDIEIVNCNFNFEDSIIQSVIGEKSYNILVEGCTIKGAYSAVSFKGDGNVRPAEYMPGIVIKNNKFEVTNSAISLNYVDSFVISGNVMENIYEGGSHNANMMFFVYTKGSFLVANNKIFGFSRTALEWGEAGYFFDMDGGHTSDGKPSYFVNNMIGGGPGSKFYNTSTVCALYIQVPIHDVYFYYNSFNMDYVGTTYGATNLSIAQSSTGLRFLNNSFAYTGGDAKSTCFTIAQPATMIDAMDYNNFYSNGTAPFVNYGGQRNNLAEIQAVDGRNQNSRVGDPEYVSATDLHSFGTQLWRAGVPIDAFTTDIDGDERDGSNPCIGADEYQALIDRDLAAIAIDGPEVLTAGEVAEFEITVLNNGRIWQSDYLVKLMKEDGTELASIEVTEAIFEDQEVTHIVEWIPTEEDMFDVYGLVVLEGDQLIYNNATEMHSIFIMPLTRLDAPVATLTVDEDEDYGTLTWDAVPGAKSYIVYGAYTFDGPWQQLTVTDKLYVSSPLVSAYGRMAFFRVVASSEPKTLLLETPRIRRDAEVKQSNR